MSPAALLPFVDKFPNVSREERDLLLDFARTTTLQYGAWKPFKQLFKKVEAALNDGHPDIEMLGVLLKRVDEAAWTQSSNRWKAVNASTVGRTPKSVEGNGFTYTIGGRNQWYDYTGWRLVVSSTEKKGVVSALRKTLGLTAQEEAAPSQTIAFDFDARQYIYEVKTVSLDGGELRIVCGPTWRGRQNPEYTFIVDVTDPQFIHLQTDGPKKPTLQYMKRRARRILRGLSQKNPDLYLQLVLQLLREEGNRVLDPALNWATFDVLFANSPRWKQTQPGRGAYKNIAGQFVRLRREERAPEIWDAHLDEARELLRQMQVPLEANEMALKVLRAHGEDADNRVLDRRQLVRFLSSDLPLLQSLATRQFAQAWQRGETIGGRAWARLVLLGSAKTRRIMLSAQPLPENNVTWRSDAAQILSEALEQRSATKKRRSAALLIERFQNLIGDDVFWRNLPTFASVSESARLWMLERVRQQAKTGQLARLSDIARLQPELQAQVMEAFFAESAHLQPSAEDAFKLVSDQSDQALNAVGWQFLAATAMTKEAARDLWQRVWNLRAWIAPAIHQTAANNEGARQIFERAHFSSDEFAAFLIQVPAFFAQLSPAFFASFFRRLSSALQIERALSANDDQWRAARATLLHTLQNPDFLATLQNPDLVDAFWNRVLERVANGADEALQKRLLDDEEIAATFVHVTSSAVAEWLAHTPMELEPYLVRWLDANINQLGRSNGALLAAATHPFGAIRALGLARIREIGLDLPLALRLMESGLPQPFEMAKSWFNTNDQLDLVDRALALCDSPNASVRAFGREFLEAHRDGVLDAKLLKKLSENADPIMQAWLAEHLLKDVTSVEVSAFDQSVLKTRGRARRAKEAVKTRRGTTIEYSNDEIKSLLDVARGRTKRDKEWALQQLAQVALPGREIEGLVVVSD